VFRSHELKFVNREILSFLKINPKSREVQLRRHLEFIFNRDIGYYSLCYVLKKLRWSWRVPTRFQTYKYTFSNMFYYCEYLEAIQSIPLEKLKFADESHIVSRNLSTGLVLGMVNTRTYTKEKTIHDASASLTILTTLTNEFPLIVDYRIESNSQWDFVDFVYYCCREGYLVNGDHLIVDNASIHSGAESYATLKLILDSFGVRLIKLPTYSPELNPDELCFSHLKRDLRKYRGDSDLRTEVLQSLASITHQDVFNYYTHCICPKVILPDL